MKKVIFMDLDGTLLTEDQKITKLNKEAISKAVAAGWDVILSTGKSLANARPFYDELELNTWMVTSQGQLIENPGNDEVITNFLDDCAVREVLNKGKPKSFVIETINGVFTNDKSDIRIVKFLNSVPKKYNGQKLDCIIGLYILVDKTHYYKHDKFDIFKWDTDQGYKVLSFKPKNINKTYALKEIVSREGYERVVVFGNGRNDLKSLQLADLGIAMVNSQKKVLAEIPFKTEMDNNNSGVGIEIQKLLDGKYDFKFNSK